ncbi:SusC/RagA family TonB-linked outer membrane protein [Mucilaginibacter auburnensis]|uniref:TonB-linked SusC/RagA family outer membrane protein n=1 Tax=Mucilaginibacter auburnensis TaxID=1457233 RepID=A0A2H9VR77_9SPHI|nr:SusC/RagA family TonB-linked outer membrane protein [Mucilaginibacter auburnensis]PJJ83309.1 TonB-linked SusC/RagA family outer membrane protein [Mucilaginibacter auburnensis]
MRKNIRNCCALLIVLLSGFATAYAQEKTDSLVNVAFRTVAKKDLIVPAASVDITEILKKSYSTNSLDNLGSFIAGYTGNVWGQAPLVLVDGIPRRASDIRMTEVQSISVLKGASAVVLYGSSAAKGVVMITTKRGSIKPLQIDVRANTGIYVPKSYPNYLNAADYKTLYNEALANDGIAPAYTADEINATRAGTNPYRYADIDFFGSDYLKKFYNKSDVTMEVSGGNEAARYYTNFGLSYNNDLLKYGEQKNNNSLQFNIRGNVDVKLSKRLSATIDAAAVSANSYVGKGNFWGATSTIAPNFNKFSPLIPISMLDPNNPALQTIVKNSNHVIDGKYLLGGQSTNQTNVLSDMLAAGYDRTKSNTFMYNLGFNADLGAVLQGLSFKTTTSLDYTSLYTESYSLPYATYRPTWSTVNGQDIITDLQKFGVDRNSTNESVGTSSYTQTVSLKAQFGYDRTFNNDHNVNAALLGWGYTTQFSSDGGSGYQPVKNTNLGFQAGYNYKRRYYLDFSGAVLHSAKLPPGKRNGFSPTVSAGWRISEENFIKDNLPFISDLKLRSSYSSVKQDLDVTGTRPGTTGAVDQFLYQGYYSNNATLGGFYTWRDGLAGGRTTLVGQADNPNLTFVQRNEFSVGLDAALFNNKITLDLNYFSQITDGLLARGTSIYPSYFAGSGDFRPWINYNKEKRTGFDFAVNLNEKVGEVQFSLGVTGMVFNSKVLRRDELPAEPYLARTGLPIDANFGYIAEGFFQSQADIANSARQTFGGTSVMPGDIKYRDVNKDGVIDAKDQVNLGHSGSGVSPFSYGVNLTVKWKRLTMFVLGSGVSGAVGYKSNPYYWVAGNGKYSDIVLGRWTDATKATATYPRLTTTSGSNNLQNSTFWMYNINRFNLSRVQFTYDFNDKLFNKSFVHNLSVYVQGDNLLVISKERKFMETNVGSAPQTRFFNIGVRGSF